VNIAVDAMGGDWGPRVVVRGGVEAAREMDLSITLVGLKDVLEEELSQIEHDPARVRIHACTQVAGMNEPPLEVIRHKKDASVRVAFELVKAGACQAAVSAGNSGATMAAALTVLGRMEGVERPAAATVLPAIRGRLVIIDVGANVDCKPSYLLQFALMGAAYAEIVLKVEQPRVALLSIGQEDHKGNQLVRQTHDLLKASSLNFIGNIEGQDLFSNLADVVVCDGFVGNVVLKLSEAMGEVLSVMLRREFDFGFWPLLSIMGLKSVFRRFSRKVDYAEIGGAPLLGVNGVGIISHGRSSPKAIKNAVGGASEFVRQDLPARIAAQLKESQDLTARPLRPKTVPDQAVSESDQGEDKWIIS